MQCERCEAVIEDGEEREYYGQILCEDCYMDLLSPTKACDPWAVYSAKTFIDQEGNKSQLNPVQQEILNLLQKEGPAEPEAIYRRMKIKKTDIERELAVLRHMEKIRGELKNGRRVVRLWD